jgi:hypothetical protein
MKSGNSFYEENSAPKDLEELGIELAEIDPLPVAHFTPDNLPEVREKFFAGNTQAIYETTYNLLDSLDFDARNESYARAMDEINTHPAIPQNHLHIYREYVERSALVNELMRQAVTYRDSADDEKKEARKKFMELNSSLYGEPNLTIAAAMIQELLADTAEADNGIIGQITEQFVARLPRSLVISNQAPSSLKVPNEVKEFMADFANYLYGPLLARVDEWAQTKSYDESSKIDAKGIAEVFQYIIDNDFPNSGWVAVLENASAVKVVASKKQVIVPIERNAMSIRKLKGLVSHELGIHMLRSIIGEGADLIPMRLGFADSGKAEEGWAKQVEATIVGGEERTGYQHYLTSTLFNKGYSFSQVFETMWRYKVLDAYLDKPQAMIDEGFLEKQKKVAFNFVFRSIRGTNDLPWHVVLNYFNGMHNTVEYLKMHKESPEMMTIPFLGKIDPSNPSHVRGALDARTRY